MRMHATVFPAMKTVCNVMAPRQTTVTSVLSHPRFSMMGNVWTSVQQELTMKMRLKTAKVKILGTWLSPHHMVFCWGKVHSGVFTVPAPKLLFHPFPSCFKSILIYYFSLNESFISFDYVTFISNESCWPYSQQCQVKKDSHVKIYNIDDRPLKVTQNGSFFWRL